MIIGELRFNGQREIEIFIDTDDSHEHSDEHKNYVRLEA